MKKSAYMCLLISLLFLFGSATINADTYDFGNSFWVDDYSGIPENYSGVYSYRIFQDGVQIVEVIDASTPTISNVITALTGVVFTVAMRNGNDLIPISNPNRYGPWTVQVPVTEAGSPTSVTTWTIRVVHGN